MQEKVMESPVEASPNQRPDHAGPERDTWSILFLASIFYLAYNGRSVTGPLLPALERDLGLTHAQCGGLFIFLFMGYVVALFGSGFIAGVIGHRGTISLSAVGVGVALMALSISQSLWRCTQSACCTKV